MKRILFYLSILIVVVVVQSQGDEPAIPRIGDSDAPQTESTTTSKATNEQDSINPTTTTRTDSQPLVFNMHLMDGLDEETYKKARGLYESAVLKRKYRFWVEYGPDDDWGQRKESEDINGAIDLLEQAGSLGFDDAYYTIGEMYEYGEHGSANFEKARNYFEKAATTGNPSAQSALGFLYSTGKNITANEPLSQLYTLFAARAGDTAAQMTMGYKYLFGHGTPKSCRDAAEWYSFAAEQVISDEEDGFGSVNELQARLSYEAENGPPAQQAEDVLQYYQYDAASGDSDSLVTMGELLLKGRLGMERNFLKAFNYFQKAAVLQNPMGLGYLGYMYANGWGVEQDNHTAIKYYKQAIDLGDPNAQTQMGIYYYRGWNVQRNYKEALRLFNLAAEQDHPNAHVQLGHMYYNGEGVTKSLEKAFSHYQAAGQHGNLPAIFHLAEMYLLGHGTVPACHHAVTLFKRVAERGLWSELLADAHDLFLEGNYETALLVYEHLAEMGFEVAQSNAAWMYSQVLGVTVKEEGWPTMEYVENQAFRYYTRAAEQNNPEAHVVLGDYYYYGKYVGNEIMIQNSKINEAKKN
eukprot:Phypoly_transcript_04075.p1 GENE.Phypoly_transcript_04075~~Phypoly_transcript_04075.p1  ORF type:complete len:596 (+),score=81.50 Phypoly_transcript_04075:54-1790(+)